MENFRQARLHARALPGSENHYIQRQNGLQDEKAKTTGDGVISNFDEGEPEGGSSMLLTRKYQIERLYSRFVQD
jgi:hypothetical protein